MKKLHTDYVKSVLYQRVQKHNSTVKDGEGTKKIGIDKNGYPIFQDKDIESTFWTNNSDLFAKQSENKQTPEQKKLENTTRMNDGVPTPTRVKFAYMPDGSKTAATFTRWNTTSTSKGTDETLNIFHNHLLTKYNEGVEVTEDKGTIIRIKPNGHSYEGKNVWYGFTTDDGFKVKNKYDQTTKKYSYNSIPYNNVYYAGNQKNSISTSEIILSTDPKLVNSFNPNQVYYISPADYLKLNLPELEPDEKTTQQYIGLQRNTGGVPQVDEKGRPLQMLIMKVPITFTIDEEEDLQ